MIGDNEHVAFVSGMAFNQGIAFSDTLLDVDPANIGRNEC